MLVQMPLSHMSPASHSSTSAGHRGVRGPGWGGLRPLLFFFCSCPWPGGPKLSPAEHVRSMAPTPYSHVAHHALVAKPGASLISTLTKQDAPSPPSILILLRVPPAPPMPVSTVPTVCSPSSPPAQFSPHPLPCVSTKPLPDASYLVHPPRLYRLTSTFHSPHGSWSRVPSVYV